MEPITFEYKYEELDFDAVARYVAMRVFKKRLWTLILFTVLFAIVAALWLGAGTDGFYAGFILGTSFVVFVTVFKYKSQAKKTWKANPQTAETLKMSLADDAVVYTTPTMGCKRLWSNFQAYVELPEHLVLFQAENPVLWLPKRHYSARINEALALIASKLPH